ncbi:MAG: hypothetical protein IPN93_11110 [Bacteroidetes bacterium]|nr:hypothetical protein [Bacteroidota bacterium]
MFSNRTYLADVNVNGSINAATEILQEETDYPFGCNRVDSIQVLRAWRTSTSIMARRFNDDFGLNMRLWPRWYMADLGSGERAARWREKYLDVSV